MGNNTEIARDRLPPFLSKMQDLVHYLAGSMPDGYGGRSTFDYTRLRDRVENYESAETALASLYDVAQDVGLVVPDVVYGTDLRAYHYIDTDAEMASCATVVLVRLLDWCKELQIDPWRCTDLVTKEQH